VTLLVTHVSLLPPAHPLLSPFSPAPPTPHPSPPRRPSDLSRAVVNSGARPVPRCCTEALIPMNPPRSRCSAEPVISATAGTIRRSEEHTSELQSLTNLVCRLLLENKNNLQQRRQGARAHDT